MDFIKGNIAGITGSIFVYPIDLVKTYMQNQGKTKIYANGFDCFFSLYKTHGFKKMYSGSQLQILAVGPEKAIKLVINDKLLENKVNPIIAGSFAGLGQVIVSNPLEFLKIQYQSNLDKKLNILKSIEMIGGIKNIYKGATLCAMRDMPFSAIFFPSYAFFKDTTNKYLPHNINNLSYLLSGMMAAIPAAYIVTPFDVIKTRIQTRPDFYKGIGETIKKIYLEEGFKAFFKGGFWRVTKSSPQFGITSFVYEMIK